MTTSWDDMVVMVATTSWDATRLADQHLALHLSARVPVLYVDPPLSPLSPRSDPRLAASLREPRLRLVTPALARLTPRALPGKSRPLMIQLTDLLLRQAMRWAVGELGGTVRAVVNVVGRPVFGACDEGLRVHLAKDDYAQGTKLIGQSRTRVRRMEARMARQADRVVVVSQPLEEKWRALGVEPLLIPNGCEPEMFAATDVAPLPQDVALPPPIVGHVGHLSDRIDLDLLRGVAERGHSLLLVGPRQRTFPLERIEPLLAMPNVAWVGAKPFSALPSYLRLIDVGVVPYTDSAFNRASFPLKTLEYLAAGRPVVATDLPAIRWLDTDLVRVAGTREDFVAAVGQALADPEQGRQADRMAFAARHSWSRRAAELAVVLGAAEEIALEAGR